MFRYRKNYKTFLKLTGDDNCALCNIKDHQVLYEDDHLRVIGNKFPYDIWEQRKVVDHLLIIPKIHVSGIAELPVDAKASLISFISKFESLGYDVYARSVGSNMRSIADHQHTHLIKTVGEPATFSVYVKKPYLVAKL